MTRDQYLTKPTPREIEVLKLIAAGLSTKQIAASLGIAFKTAACHRARVMEKLDIHEVAGLTRYAIRNGYIEVSGSGNDPLGSTQEQLFERVRVAYEEYQRALEAYARFLEERESIGSANPDNSHGRPPAWDGEKAAHRKYDSALADLKDFLLRDSV